MTKGHNNPPEQTPFEAAQEEITALYEEASHWLDGEQVTTEGQASALTTLIGLFRAAAKTADAARKAEKKPHLDAGRDIDAKYKPLSAQTDRALKTLKNALAPWLAEKERAQREAEEKARLDAEEKRRAAQEKMAAAQETASLAERAQAEQMIEDARQAEKDAAKAAKATATAKGNAGRAVSLRTSLEPEIADLTAAAKFYWDTDKSEFIDLIVRLAARDIRAGRRTIPGINILEKRSVA